MCQLNKQENSLPTVIWWPLPATSEYNSDLHKAKQENEVTKSLISTTNLAACVCVCAQNLTNFCPHAFISNPNVPKIVFA